jgi:hypothetical protein
MSRHNKNTLSERQELLLSQYFDGECGCVSRYRAQSLLRRSQEARAFLEQLSSISTECQESCSGSDCCADLWQKISARIDNEERAAFYLGSRRETSELPASRFFDRIRDRQVILGGLSGAALAALALVFITRTGDIPEIATVARTSVSGSNIPSEVTQVALGGSGARLAENRGMHRYAPTSTMEVDWMRANGPLALIQNPNGKSAIIWVRRKPGAAMRNARQPVASTPTMAAMLEQGLDGSPLNQSK